MIDLSESESAVLAEIIAGPGWLPNQPGQAWTQRRVLELVFGSQVIAGLITLGWLVDWPELEAITLTPWAADQLGVKIEERPGDEIEVWVPTTDPEPPFRLPKYQGPLPCLDQLPDPMPAKAEPTRAEYEAPRLAGGLGRVLGDVARRRKPGRYLAG
jgi:hypothetical protein